jgi:geranylgeranyl diphosphate synthase type I
MIDTDNRTNIQHAMRTAFPDAEAQVAQFYAMMEYHLGWRDGELRPSNLDPGKLLRPQMALLAACAVGGSAARALPLAAGIQLIHDFSLIHDDIEDNSDTRRGRATVWKKWGLAQGINTGDGMFVIAHLAVHRLAEAGVNAPLVLEILRRFDETILRICEGQFLDLSYEGNLSITEDDYLAMINRKTAALVAGATEMGAMVGEANEASTRALFEFGHNLGLAFQIQDDILGIWGDPTLTGKPYAADLYQCKVSLPIIHALRNADDRDTLAEIYRARHMDDDAVQRGLNVLNAAGAQAHSEQVAAHYHQQAMQALARVRTRGIPTAETALMHMKSMAERLVGRRI